MGAKLTAAARARADKRAAMIAEAAYFIAERRNFQPGHELSDWLTAEQEVDSILGSNKPAPATSVAEGAARKPAKKKAKKKAKKVTVKKVAKKKVTAKKARKKAKKK